jgi:YD repeat-containing protein
MPKIAPPSPTVAAMMKFEEVPVNNYTGVPDISIPLYSTATHSKDIGISLSLNYHPASAAATQVASYVGLGWSFFAGGTISRTVKGLPDDTTETGKYGMWHASNKYDQVMALLGNVVTEQDREIVGEYMWEAGQKGKYDTEYDLFQYNFMGYSGRFYINKNYQVVKLDTSTLKIMYDRVAKTFTIFDDKGYKYFFDIKETTTQSGFSRLHYINNDTEDTTPTQTDFISAFHLSKISNIKPVIDPQFPNAQQDDVLVTFAYNDTPIYEKTHTTTRTDIRMSSVDYTTVKYAIETSTCDDIPGKIKMIEPLSIDAGQDLYILTRKLKGILVKDFAKIEFITQTGRSDYNLLQPETASKLTDIIIKEYNTLAFGDASDKIVKKFTLSYSYSNPAYKGDRLILTEVKEINYTNNVADAQIFSHKLYYNKINFGGYQSLDFGKDFWGYFNLTPLSNRFNRETSSVCTLDLLQKMTLPSGGCVLYKFEPHTYSYIGSTALVNFDENPDNWTSTDGELNFSNSPYAGPTADASPKLMPFSLVDQYITFSPGQIAGGGGFRLQESVAVNGVHSATGPFTTVANLYCGYSGCKIDRVLAAGKYYKVSYLYLIQGETYSATLYYQKKMRETPTREWLYGGGVRIKKVGYFEDDAVAANHYEIFTGDNIFPVKEKEYSYQFFDNVWRSSGSLASGKPNFSYNLTKKHGIVCAYFALPTDSYSYDYYTSFDNLPSTSTQGSAVGYKYVTVRDKVTQNSVDVTNGRQEYTYDSPINEADDPEAYLIAYPFIPQPSYDYRRGMLANEKVFDKENNLLLETTYTFTKDDKNPVTTGIRFFTSSGSNCPYSNQFANYDQYISRVQQCPPGASATVCIFQCGDPLSFISYTKIWEAFGWSRLTSKTTKEYFYNGATQNGILETTQNYTYNSINHLTETTETVTYSGTTPEKVKSKYYYYNSTENINRISEVEKIETFKNDVLTGSQNIIFSNTIGTSWFSPSIIQSAKGTQTLEDRLQIKKYDAFGNVLEVKQAGGLPVSYVYGYNNTKPIAMIEGTGYDSFSPITSYITAAQNASNTDTGDVPTDGTLTPLMNALVNLRTQMAANLSMIPMITTYTYKPFKGVTSVTDPKGSITSYTYDAAGQLIMVRDETGKILSENKYNYRP